MSQEILLRALFSGIFALVFAWVVFSRYDREIGSESTEKDRQKYLPYIPGSLLPLMLITILVLGTFYYGVMGAAKLTLSAFFGVFLHICVYDLLLILVLPFFRRHISARACAMLWVIPNYLYITVQSFMQLPKPLLVISVPGKLVWILFGIWLAGFLAVLIRKTVQHLTFRHHILCDATPVTDP